MSRKAAICPTIPPNKGGSSVLESLEGFKPGNGGESKRTLVEFSMTATGHHLPASQGVLSLWPHPDAFLLQVVFVNISSDDR